MQRKVQPTNTTSIPTAEVENPSPASGDGVRVARWSQNPNADSMAALNVGTLAIVNNCLVMSNKDAPPTLPIFPYGYGVWDDAKRTFTYEGKAIRIGETIEVGGGRILDLESFLKGTGKKYDIPDCGTTDYWLAP
jgi:hypothetical protein